MKKKKKRVGCPSVHSPIIRWRLAIFGLLIFGKVIAMYPPYLRSYGTAHGLDGGVTDNPQLAPGRAFRGNVKQIQHEIKKNLHNQMTDGGNIHVILKRQLASKKRKKIKEGCLLRLVEVS